MIRRPPRSTLFPHDALPIYATGGTNTKITFVIVDPATAEGDFLPPVATLQLKGTLQFAGVYRSQDRKSTRLNSSHANISYAVFCLSKNTSYHRSSLPSLPSL